MINQFRSDALAKHTACSYVMQHSDGEIMMLEKRPRMYLINVAICRVLLEPKQPRSTTRSFNHKLDTTGADRWHWNCRVTSKHSTRELWTTTSISGLHKYSDSLTSRESSTCWRSFLGYSAPSAAMGRSPAEASTIDSKSRVTETVRHLSLTDCPLVLQTPSLSITSFTSKTVGWKMHRNREKRKVCRLIAAWISADFWEMPIFSPTCSVKRCWSGRLQYA